MTVWRQPRRNQPRTQSFVSDEDSELPESPAHLAGLAPSDIKHQDARLTRPLAVGIAALSVDERKAVASNNIC
jgi:hypothetical protein